GLLIGPLFGSVLSATADELPQPPPAKPMQPPLQENTFLATSFPAAQSDGAGYQAARGPRADYVLVNKSERHLKLSQDGEEIAHFPVKLGKQPVGHKLYEGDNRT